MKKKNDLASVFFTFIFIFLSFFAGWSLQWIFTPIPESLMALDAYKGNFDSYIFGLTGILFKATTISISLATFLPLVSGLLLWTFRKFILRFITRKIEADLQVDIEEIRRDLTKNFKESLDEQLEAFNKERGRQRMLIVDIRKYLLDSSEDNLEKEKITEISSASDEIQNSIFVEAKSYFLEKCKESVGINTDDKYNDVLQSLSKTNTIFASLVKSDQEENKNYFQSRAFLAYGIFYQKYPDIDKKSILSVLDLINQAINIRNKFYEKNNIPNNSSYYIYELKRAIFLIIQSEVDRTIELDDIKQDIYADLEDACNGYYRLQKILKTILNNISNNRQESISDVFIGDYLSRNEVSKLKYFLENYPNYCDSLKSNCLNF